MKSAAKQGDQGSRHLILQRVALFQIDLPTVLVNLDLQSKCRFIQSLHFNGHPDLRFTPRAPEVIQSLCLILNALYSSQRWHLLCLHSLQLSLLAEVQIMKINHLSSSRTLPWVDFRFLLEELLYISALYRKIHLPLIRMLSSFQYVSFST